MLHQRGDIWKVVPLGLMWDIWREHNNRAFEGSEWSMTDLKMVLLLSLFEWMTVLPCHFCSNLFEFIGCCNFS